MKRVLFLLSIVLIFVAGCTSSKKATSNNSSSSATASAGTQETASKPVTKKAPKWLPDPQPYQPSRTRTWDLKHTKLDVRFDWAKQHLIGKAWLKLSPYFYTTHTLDLDAKGFELKNVKRIVDGEEASVKYTYDGKVIHLEFAKDYKKQDELTLLIEYVAKPNELEEEGSNAITDAKGLYFINPEGKTPNKPRQIWTQGETQSSSCWFPTIDSPNERTTQETYITVEDKMVTLCNGILINQQNNPDGTRTDYWKMELPHAPYLFMMAIGEFSVTHQKWNGIPVDFYVEQDYGKYAADMFANTTEMLQFFSDRLGVTYPWSKFSQVVVRDFVSGAMENTTAVIHGPFLNKDSRALLDGNNENIIAHEMFHHWFGDLVTCESWSNLPLNESFATYGEYLWQEFKHGKDDADHHLHFDLEVYLMESARKREPLIRYHYRHQEDMFDAHSYQKGGRVLHMLRNLVGDEAFFESLKQYLNKNAFSDVEIDELRLAFEDVTGQDLNWFFDQWFLQRGHPEIRVEYVWDEVAKQMLIKVNQAQDPEYSPIYRIPTKIEFVRSGNHQVESVELNSADTTYVYNFNLKPDYVVFDADKILLGDVFEKKTDAEWTLQLTQGSNYVQKAEAFKKLALQIGDENVAKGYLQLTSDPFWAIRQKAVSGLEIYEGDLRPEILKAARKIAVNDRKASVRRAAVHLIGEYTTGENQSASTEDKQVLLTALNDSSYAVVDNALKTLYKIDPEAAIAKAREFQKITNPSLAWTVADLFLEAKLPESYPVVENLLLNEPDGMEKFQLLAGFAAYLKEADNETKAKGIKLMEDFAGGESAWWVRLSAARSLGSFMDEPGVTQFLKDLRDKETNNNFKAMLEGMVGKG
ncbi:MAG: M1 family metallopeptidase [Bacteroidia bacterium]|nr:M1 family metallopeptidase [Bacteroidia bacterium]